MDNRKTVLVEVCQSFIEETNTGRIRKGKNGVYLYAGLKIKLILSHKKDKYTFEETRSKGGEITLEIQRLNRWNKMDLFYALYRITNFRR